MTKKLFFVIAILSVMTLAVMAAGIDGKWTSEQAGRNGGAARVTTYMFKADGSTLTGTVTTPGFGGGEPMETKISEGKVEGNNISFKVTREFNGNSFSQEYKGTLDGDTLNFKVTSPGRNGGDPMTRDMVAKRATT